MKTVDELSDGSNVKSAARRSSDAGARKTLDLIEGGV